MIFSSMSLLALVRRAAVNSKNMLSTCQSFFQLRFLQESSNYKKKSLASLQHHLISCFSVYQIGAARL